MKRYIALLLSVVLVFSVIGFSSCMKVTVTVPGADFGVVEDIIGGNQQGNQGSADVNATLAPEITTAPVVTFPAETTVPAVNNEATTAPSVSPKTPLEMNDNELLEYFNNNLNGIKENKPGFTKSKLTTVSDIVLSNQLANSLVGFVKGALLSEETEVTPVAKGASSIDVVSPDGQRYVSQLLGNEIKSIDVKVEGTGYAVTVQLPDAKNPTKDEGYYAKIFTFITVDDVEKIYAPKVGATVARNNIEVNYSGCYAKAVFSPDGKVISYETYVTCVMSLKEASIKKGITINTDVDITLESKTNYTDFSY